MAARTLEVDTALAKLARTLDVDESEVEFLGSLSVDELRSLRLCVVDGLKESDRKRLQAVAAASKVVPAPLAATIGERWFGPVLCAQLIDLIDPKRARVYTKHLSTEFMADITTRVDPRLVGGLVEHLSMSTVRKIATAVVERDDHLTLSHFVGHVPSETVVSVLDVIEDDATVVRIARFVEDMSHLDPIVAQLADARLVSLVAAVDDQDLWPEAMHLFSSLGDEQIFRVASVIVNHDASVVRAALEGFERHDLWEQGLVLVESLDEGDIVRLADALLLLDDAVIHGAVDAIDRLSAWDVLVRIAVAATDLGDDVRSRLRSVVDDLPKARIKAFDSAAKAAGHAGLRARVLDTAG